ncbi:MAG: GNAT family N-acetyltransferase [Pseudomonadota bacterium]
MDQIWTVEPAQGKDAATMALLSRNLIEYGLPWRWTPGRLRRCINHPDYVALTARHGPTLGGFAVMQFYTRRAHLCLLGVVPSLRRQGLGGRLLNWLEESCRIAGVFDVELEVRESNRGAVKFYQQRGFVTSKRIRHYYTRGEHAVRMRHDLRRL